ncbi:MAG: VanZ family protein [Caldilineales bacterium]|nr:VanZ family protein [Caldilineales bacterium]
MSRPYRLLAALIALAFLAFVGFIIFSADTGTMPAVIHRLYAFPHGDKAGHFVLMGVLALALNLALSTRRVSMAGRKILLGSLLALLLVTIEELSQAFFRTRTLSLLDLSFSYVGILGASLLIGSIEKGSKHEGTK